MWFCNQPVSRCIVSIVSIHQHRLLVFRDMSIWILVRFPSKYCSHFVFPFRAFR